MEEKIKSLEPQEDRMTLEEWKNLTIDKKYNKSKKKAKNKMQKLSRKANRK